MSSIFDSITQQITSGAIQQVSQRLGVDPALAQQMVNIAIPAIMTGIAAHAATSGGADAIHREATKQADGVQQGNALPQVLGDQHDAVADRLSKVAGVSREDATKILAALAPAVMRGIGQHVRDAGLNPNQLQNALGAAAHSANIRGSATDAGQARL